MPSDIFSPTGSPEFSKDELEKLVKISLDRRDSSSDILYYFARHKWVRFIVTPDYKLIVSTHEHIDLCKSLGIEREHCLIRDGDLNFNPAQNQLNFIYSMTNYIPKSDLYKVTEAKIVDFLRGKGMAVTSTGNALLE